VAAPRIGALRLIPSERFGYTSQQTHRPVPIPKSIRTFIAARELHLA
jgi:hypothetical protein